MKGIEPYLQEFKQEYNLMLKTKGEKETKYTNAQLIRTAIGFAIMLFRMKIKGREDDV